MGEIEEFNSNVPPEDIANYSRLLRNGLAAGSLGSLVMYGAAANYFPKDIPPQLFLYIAAASAVGAVVAHFDHRYYSGQVTESGYDSTEGLE
jgi:hypothetical protein